MIPDDLRYTKEHEWARVEGNSIVVGITEHAQQQLGDIVFVDLPPVGKDVVKNEEAVALESTKAAASVYAPAGGKISAVNDTLADDPALVNGEPYGNGWIYKLDLSNPADLDDLMDAAAYEAYLKEID